MRIHCDFDSGNIEVIDASDPAAIRLAIRPDVGEEHMQWFHFRASGARGVPCAFRLENASSASYPSAWPGYLACASADRISWTRVDTTYEGGVLHIRHTPTTESTWYAYFPPYSHEQHQDLIARSGAAPGVRAKILGDSLDGAPMDLLEVGEGPIPLWFIARQHPGESMAEWWMEGFLARLLDPDDALARQLRARATFHIVPNMNPDGSRRGHLRCNAIGANLNREWHAPTMARSPEVRLVLDEMDRTGVDLCLDVHGDEELPYVFLADAAGIPGWTDRLARLSGAFLDALIQANPDLQKDHGYPVDAPGQADMSLCTNQTAQRFDCLSLTLEMPFKDNANAPDPVHGWSPARSIRMGASALDAVAAVLGELR